MRIYTRGGDKGETRLIGNKMAKKSDFVFEALGDMDELNSSLGLVLASVKLSPHTRKFILEIQNTLFDVGALLANPATKETDFEWLANLTTKTEGEIDKMDKSLKPLKTFILPGGSKDAALIHSSRTICRRAERKLVAYKPGTTPIRYLNRLSDFLFVLARYANHQAGKNDTLWQPRPKK